jgi:hypothetical protein
MILQQVYSLTQHTLQQVIGCLIRTHLLHSLDTKRIQIRAPVQYVGREHIRRAAMWIHAPHVHRVPQYLGTETRLVTIVDREHTPVVRETPHAAVVLGKDILMAAEIQIALLHHLTLV